MKIYTRSGDDGTTGLIGGQRVAKDDPRVQCYGTVDELNATLGLAAAAVSDELRARLVRVQHELFTVGSHLALPEAKDSGILPLLDEAMVHGLEREIDEVEHRLAPLRHFILPGGTEGAARLHVARTVCRRCERLVVAFAAGHEVEPLVICYLNRLADWLFVMARLVNHEAGVGDVIWRAER